MIVIAVMAASGGYFFAMVLNPAEPPTQVFTDAGPAPMINDLLGQLRPDFLLHDTDGVPVSASEFDGQVWLANFWATWCAPCVEEMPMLSRLQQDYADQGVKIVGIALDDPQRAGEFAAGLGVSYRILVGKTDVVLAGRRYGNSSGMLPFSVLIDAEGIIRWTHLGALSSDELTAQIQMILSS